MRKFLGILIGSLMLTAAPAGAHPHVWIEANATLVFERGKVTAIRLHWTFDQIFSSAVIGEYDKNKDKSFNAAETADLRKNAFSNLKHYSYFTHLRIAGKPAEASKVAGFKASIVKGQLVYRFTLRLDDPVDPLKTPLGVTLYDKSFYVDVQFRKKNPLRLVGKGSAGCTHSIAKDKNNPIYFGLVFPRVATLRCAGS